MTEWPLKRLRKIRQECQQLINDIEWWNANRTEHPPFDCEPEKVMVGKVDACIAALGSPAEAAAFKDMADYAQQVQREE